MWRFPVQAAAGVPPIWNTWIAVDSVDTALEAATNAGGTVLMPAMDIPDSGRMVYIADPSGAAVGLWQAKQHIGAELVSEPGAIIWNELQATDAPTEFYEKLAGIGTAETDMGDGPPYTTFVVGESTVGGTMPPAMEGVPNHWHVYFGTDDVDGSMAKAKDLGGQVLAGPIPTPIGPMAVMQDPQGAVFSVYHPNEWPT